jgi:hypothetical protein
MLQYFIKHLGKEAETFWEKYQISVITRVGTELNALLTTRGVSGFSKF